MTTEIGIATMKFTSIPITPIPSGDMPNHQFSGVLYSGCMNLNQTMYEVVNAIPAIIPVIAPGPFILLEKIPITMAGKNEDAARPKANATIAAT